MQTPRVRNLTRRPKRGPSPLEFKQYPSLQAFAAAVGMTDRAVSDALHGYQDMPVEAFNEMLGKVWYALKIVPLEKS